MAQRTILYALKITEDGAGGVRARIESIGDAADESERKVKSLGTRMRGHLNGATEEGERLSKGMLGVVAALTAASVAVDKLLSGNREWDQSTSILTTSLGKVREKLSETFGPTMSRWLRAVMIGVAGIAGAIGAIPTAVDKVRDSFDTGKIRGEVAAALPNVVGAEVAGKREMRIQGGISLDPYAADRRSTSETVRDTLIAGVRDAIKGLDDIARDVMAGTGKAGKGGSTVSYADVIGNAGPISATGRITATTGPSAFDIAIAATANRLDRVGEEIPKAFEPIFKALDGVAEDWRRRQENRAKVAGAIGGVSGIVSSGGSFGSIGALSGNPIVGAVGGLLDSRDQIAGVLSGLDDEIVDLVRDLPRIIVVDLPLALIRDFLPGLIKGLGEAFLDALKAVFGGDAKTKRESVLRTAYGDRFTDALKDDDFRAFGLVKTSGFLGGGDSRGTRDRGNASRTSGGPRGDINVHVYSRGRAEDTAREVGRELRRLQGNRGSGLSLDPLGD